MMTEKYIFIRDSLEVPEFYTCFVKIRSYNILYYNTEIVPSDLVCESCANLLTRKQQRFAYNKFLGRELLISTLRFITCRGLLKIQYYIPFR